jgi:hypothetical protein
MDRISRPQLCRLRLFDLALVMLALQSIVSGWAALAQQTDGDNKISYPDATGLTAHYLDTIVVSYETDYDTPWLYLFCVNNNKLQEILYYSPSDTLERTTRDFQLQYTYMVDSPCWFNLRSSEHDTSDNTTDDGASSPIFSYRAAQGAAETTFAISATAAASSKTTDNASATGDSESASSTNGSTDSAETDSPTNADSDSDSQSQGISGGVAAGIAIGVVALLAILGVVGWLLFVRRRKLNSGNANNFVAELDNGGNGEAYPRPSVSTSPTYSREGEKLSGQGIAMEPQVPLASPSTGGKMSPLVSPANSYAFHEKYQQQQQQQQQQHAVSLMTPPLDEPWRPSATTSELEGEMRYEMEADLGYGGGRNGVITASESPVLIRQTPRDGER